MGKEAIGMKAGAKVWHLVQRLYTQRLVDAAYYGVLGREPDAAGAESYALVLRGQGELAGVIGGLAASDESWERQLIARAPAMVRNLADGLLGEACADEGLRSSLSALAVQGDLETAVLLLVRSDAYWNTIFADRSQQLLEHIDRTIFDSQPDVRRLADWAVLLEQGPFGLADVFACLLNSQLTWERLVVDHADELIHAAFGSVLGRSAEPEALAEYRRRIQNVGAYADVLSDIVLSEEAWQRQILLRAGELLQAVFRGLFGRAADPQERAEYEQRLRTDSSLSRVIAEIACSDEAWECQMGRHAEEMIAMAYQVVLARRPDESEIAHWTQRSMSMSVMRDLLNALLESDDFQVRQFSGSAKEAGWSTSALDAIYRGVLGRPVDVNGLQEYEIRIKSSRDLEPVIATLLKSTEFRNSYRKQDPDPRAPTGAVTSMVARIEVLYQRYRKREATAREIGQHLLDETPIWEIEKRLLSEAPAREGPLRVMLFGAYGNGNMGDAYQALAVRSHLAAHFGETPIEVSACSLLDSSDYVFPNELKLAPQAILDADLVNSFDYLVIGGGGLLAHPHDPLADQEWCRRIHAPIILLAIGASEPEVGRHDSLLGQALHVIGRDEASVCALSKLRPDVRLAPDPILSLGAVRALLSSPILQPAKANSPDVLWILKYAANAVDSVLLAQIREQIFRSDDVRHLIVGIEPALDHVLSDMFEGVPLLLTENLDELAGLISGAGRVFSMRYHGAIFALLMERPVLGASQSKLRELAHMLGQPTAYLESCDQVHPDMWKHAMTASSDQLTNLNTGFAHMLAELQLVA